MIKRQMQADETSTRHTLRRTQQSESSKNIHLLNITTEKFQSWLKNMKKDQMAQAVLATTITDTAFRIFDKRLKCSTCPGNSLSMTHIMECPEFTEERQDVELYTQPDRSGRKLWNSTDMYKNFCAAAKGKLYKVVNDAKNNQLLDTEQQPTAVQAVNEPQDQ